MSLSAGESQDRTESYYAWGVCGFLLVAIGLIYGQSLGNTLLNYDDNLFVSANPQVTAGLTGDWFRRAFTGGPAGEWYPLATLSHMVDCQLYGPNAWGHHLTNVVLHIAASIALFLVLWRMTDELWPSAFVAAVFAVHPQHVESVAWIAERRDVLSGLFFMLTLAAYLGYVRHDRSLTRYLLVAAMLALGLMAKSMLVTVPPLLVLLDFWPLARFGSAIGTPRWTHSLQRPSVARLVLEKLPLVALTAGACVMTLRTHPVGVARLAWPARIGNAAVACVTYVGQFFYPIDLAAYYPNPVDGPPIWKVAGAIAILVVASAAAVIWRRRCPYAFVGWFWYLGMLTPVLGLIKIADHALADRYMYLPGIGLYIAVAWGAARLAGGSLAARWALGACAGLAIAALLALATWQTSFWRDDETLWRHALACTTDNGIAEIGVADALARRGQLDAAIPYYRRAQQHALNGAPYNNLGLVLSDQDKADEAIDQFRRALEIEPDSFDAHVNLAITLATQNRFDEAREHFDRALEINPRGVNAHGGLAHLLLLEGKLDEARAEFEQAVAIAPGNLAARNGLASLLLQHGKTGEAIEHIQAALAIDPNNPTARQNLDALREGFR